MYDLKEILCDVKSIAMLMTSCVFVRFSFWLASRNICLLLLYFFRSLFCFALCCVFCHYAVFAVDVLIVSLCMIFDPLML